MARKILRSEAPQNDSSLVILSEAKNLFSRLRDMARKILRRCAPQNDSSLVILSEAKNLPSCLRGMAQKILRSEAPQNDRVEGTQNDRRCGEKDSSERSSSE